MEADHLRILSPTVFQLAREIRQLPKMTVALLYVLVLLMRVCKPARGLCQTQPVNHLSGVFQSGSAEPRVSLRLDKNALECTRHIQCFCLSNSE